MPIYEYRCRACGATVEELRSVDRADAPVDCGCDTPDQRRLPSLPLRPASTSVPPTAAGASGCCGGGCGCG